MLAEMLERLLDAENEFEARRQRLAAATPARMALWPKFSEQGILCAGFAEEAGGFGGSIRDIAVVMEQACRKLVVEPILSTTVCGRILQRAGHIEAVASFIACECSYADRKSALEGKRVSVLGGHGGRGFIKKK